MHISKVTGAPIVLLASVGLALPAMAAIEEVVVTATKRESSLQEIPMSISAISGEAMEKEGVADFTDVATTVPSDE